MMKTKLSIRGIFFFISSLIASFYVGIAPSCPDQYAFLSILPLAFSICALLFGNLIARTKKSTSALVIVVLYYIRFTIVPLVMTLGNYSGYYAPNNILGAIVLMVYELVCVFAAADLATKRNVLFNEYNSELEKKSLTLQENSLQKRVIFGIVFLGIVVFMIFVVVKYPSIQNLYTSMFSYEGGLLTTESISTISNNTGGRSFLTLFSLLFDFMRLLIPTYIFLEIKKIFGNRLLSLVLSIPIILIQFVFVGATAALAIICVFINLMVLVQLYPKYRDRVLRIAYTGAVGAVAIIFLIKLNNTLLYTEGGWGSLSSMLQAYFAGVNNVGACFNIPKELKWDALFYDLYYTIPFNGTLFGLSGQTSANLFNQYNYGKFQIIPCIGQAYYYLGPVLAPLIPSLMVYYSIRIHGKTNKEKNAWMYTAYTLVWVYLAMSPIMYNGQILLVRMTNTIIPCLLVALISKRRGKNTKNEG